MFNALTITGRLSFAELVEGDNGPYLSVTLISELMNDTEGVSVNFTNQNGLISLFKNGRLNKGRMITVTGHLNKFEETYFNKKTGKRAILQRPRLTLGQAQVLHGGFGPGEKRQSVEIDQTPSFEGEPTLEEIQL